MSYNISFMVKIKLNQKSIKITQNKYLKFIYKRMAHIMLLIRARLKIFELFISTKYMITKN